MLEFARHALGQRQTAAQLLRGYDLGYFLKKKGSSASSPWVVSLGPVAVLALVHCALAGMGGPVPSIGLASTLQPTGSSSTDRTSRETTSATSLGCLALYSTAPMPRGMLLLPFPEDVAMDKKA